MSDELFERLPQKRHTRQANAERKVESIALGHEITRLWLQGLTSRQIATQRGITVQHVNRLLVAARAEMAEGFYDAKIARKAADGVTNLPVLANAGKGKAGRPVKPFTPEEQAMRDEFALGKLSIAALARKHNSYTNLVRYTLKKSPSVLK